MQRVTHAARLSAVLAVLAIAGCAHASRQTSQTVHTTHSVPAPTRIDAAPVPPGWHRVAHLALDPVHPADSLIGDTWTARSSVRWVFRCQTLRGTSPETLVLQLQDVAHGPKSMSFSPSSPGWLECPLAGPATKQGTFAVRPAKSGQQGVDVNMQLLPVIGSDTVIDGNVLFRVDAFEPNR